jgi:UDP-galactopyranose mutase
MKKLKALINRLKCLMDMHDRYLLPSERDPFQGIPGHGATQICTRCTKSQRALQHGNGHIFVMPWVEHDVSELIVESYKGRNH